MLHKIKYLSLLLFIGLLSPINVLAEWQTMGQIASDTQNIQIVFVTDVSGSMGYYVLSKDLPMDLAIMQNRVAEIQDSPYYQSLTEKLVQIEEAPAYLEVKTTYETASLAQNLWLLDHNYPDLDTLYFDLEDKFDEIGCSSGYADLYESDGINGATQQVNEACKYASVSQEDRDSVLVMVGFLSDAEYISLRQKSDQLKTEMDQVRVSLGYEQINKEIGQYLSISSYYDLKSRLNIRAKELGFPYRLELAKQTAQIITDLSQLDQISNNRESSFSLVRFANMGTLLQPLTNDYDLMKSQIDELGFYGATNIGVGLTLALEELEQNGDPQQPSAIVLLSDGKANRGMTRYQILTEIPPHAKKLNTRICAVGFGNREADIDAELLRTLAKETGGKYAFAQTGNDLVSFYTACRQSLITDNVSQLTGIASSGKTVDAGDIQVAENTDVLEITLTYLSGEMELVLVDPLGQEVDVSSPDVDIQSQANVQLITVKNPIPNQWAVRVRSVDENGESSVYNITIGSKVDPKPPPPTAAPTATERPTSVSTSTPLPTPEQQSASKGFISPVFTISISAILLLATLGCIAVFFWYQRKRQTPIRLIHVIISAGGLFLVLGFGLVFTGTNLGYINLSASPKIIAFGPTPTHTLTSTTTSTSTNTPTPTIINTPTQTPSLTLTQTPSSTPTPVPIAIQADNIDRLSLLENVLDNSFPGFQSSDFYAMALSPDGKTIATDGYYCDSITCQDFIKVLQILPEGIIPIKGLLDPDITIDEENWISDLEINPKGDMIASSRSDGKIRIWNIDDGSLVRTLTGHTSAVRSIDFSSDGTLLASGSEDSTVKLWDVSDGSEIRSIKAANNEIYGIDISPDGSLLAVIARQRDAFLRLWRVSDGRLERTLIGHSTTPFCVSFSPDGKLVASGNYDGNILVHETDSGRLVFTLKGHTGGVKSVNFSNNGTLLASAGYDNTIMIWDMANGQLLRTLDNHNRWTTQAIFFSDDSFLLTAARYDSLLLWGIQP